MSTHYQIYHESVIRLVATLVVKDEMSAEIINNRLSTLGYAVDIDRPETWKYYLNLAGQYHPSDAPMVVTSMDTLEEIEFTVENMALHRATWREHQYGSRYYKELVAKYPQQDALIHGVLNPVPLSTAIEAADHTILWHDPALVEGRETNLISELQAWIKGLFTRYDMRDYRINNPYFVAAKLAILFMAMPEAIKAIRLANARTNRAHSYHIKRYLASFGPLDQHYTAMNEFQRLYFYRNIRFLLKNNGKDDIFQELVENVMTERSFPVAEYAMQQNDSGLETALVPQIQYERRSINAIPSAMGEDIVNTPIMLDLQRRLARNNPGEIPYAESYVPETMQYNLNAEVKTKSLESNVLDLKESEPYTLSDVLLNQWILFADNGLYRTVLLMQLPDGGDGVRLSMREAWIVYQYLYFLRSGIELTTIPRIMAKRVRRNPLPTFEELRGITTRRHTPDAFIREALKDNVRIESYVSVDAFLETCQTIHKRMMLHRDLYVFREDLYQYAEVKLMTDRFYADIPVDMDQGQVYATWLLERGLSFDHYSPAELDEILLGILNQATGLELRTAQTLKDIQAAMLGIMGQLSSYSVHYIQQINEEAVMMFDWGHLRYHNEGGAAATDLKLEVPAIRALELYGTARPRAHVDLSNLTIQNFGRKASHDLGIDLGLNYALSGLNQTIPRGINLAPVMSTNTAPTHDLAQYNGTSLVLQPLTSRPLSDLFDRVQSDDYVHP